MPEIIRLTPYEISIAAQVGCMRVTESLRTDQKWGHNYSGSVYKQFADSISGACAEFAVAQYLKILPQIHCNNFDRADIIVNGTQIQVKSQTPKPNGKPLLYIRQNAHDGELFCFVVDKSPEFEILGFIMAKDIINDDTRLTNFGKPRPPVYQLQVNELKELKDIV